MIDILTEHQANLHFSDFNQKLQSTKDIRVLDGLSRRLAWSTFNLHSLSSQLSSVYHQYLLDHGLKVSSSSSVYSEKTITFVIKYPVIPCPEYRTYLNWILAFQRSGYSIKLLFIGYLRPLEDFSQSSVNYIVKKYFPTLKSVSVQSYNFSKNWIHELSCLSRILPSSPTTAYLFCSDSTNKLSHPYSALKYILPSSPKLFGLSTIISTGISGRSFYLGGKNKSLEYISEFSEQFIGLDLNGYILSHTPPHRSSSPLISHSDILPPSIRSDHFAVCGSNFHKLNIDTLLMWSRSIFRNTPIILYPFPPHYSTTPSSKQKFIDEIYRLLPNKFPSFEGFFRFRYFSIPWCCYRI